MNKTTAEILKAIECAQTVLVCGHIRPDGDCVSSALAVRRICEKAGKLADAVCDADKPESFAFLPDFDKFCVTRRKKYDLFIAVDCATDKRLGIYQRQLDEAENSISIDHHPTNGRYSKYNYIVPNASSTCEVLFDLFGDTEYVDKEVATMLYTGLSTDTGHFMHGNTNVRVFEIAAKLCGLGVDAAKVNHDIYCNKRFEKIKLTARALESIKLYHDGRIALMTIDAQDLRECDCTSEDTEGLIDNASSIHGVEIAISMCEQPGSLYRVSYRSTEADVAAAAETFGGGGHKLAAGCIITGNKFDVAEKVVNAAKVALDKLR